MKTYEKPSIMIESLISDSAIAINEVLPGEGTTNGEVSVSMKDWFDDNDLLGDGE